MNAEQRIVRFFGNVQGVGFRYTACGLAGRYNVSGYVRNMPDGSVECVIEGPTDQIEAFLADLGGEMSGYINRTTEQKAPATGGYKRFGVQF